MNESQANQAGNAANHKALRSVRSRVIEVQVNKAAGAPEDSAAAGKSNALPDDPLHNLVQTGRVVEPPFDLLTLAMLCEHNSELGQCVEAMETNIEGYGHRFVPRINKAKAEKEQPTLHQEAVTEHARLVNFFTYCTTESYTAFRRKLRRDLEMTGNAYFEVMRANGEIVGFTHIPSYQVRLGRVDDQALLIDQKVTEIQPDGSVKLAKRKAYRRFRKYVQSRTIHRRTLQTVEGSRVRWFKEFGDPRHMHRDTGDFETEQKKVPESARATEVIHLKIYSSRSPYGIPRYIGNLLSIFGDRAAEEINYITFKNNNIPSMVVLVSNGQLTEGSIARIQNFVDSQIQGSDNYSKFLLLEGEPFGDEEGEDGGQVKVDVKPLVREQHKDALFQNYSEKNQDKIRRAFRLPPIFVGRADDYSRATAEASRKLANDQVFTPERNEFDALVNRILFPEMGITYHSFKSNSPTTTDTTELVKVLSGSEKTGGMTPRIARAVLQEVLSQDLPDFPEDFPADVPFSLTMAEAVKSQADPTEPGQTVTALKTLETLGIVGDDGSLAIDDSQAAEVVLKLQERVEKMWRERAANFSADVSADEE